MNNQENAVASRLMAVPFICLAIMWGCSIQPSPEKVVRDYEKAANSHSVEALMSLFTDDVVVSMPTIIEISGKKDLRGKAEYDSTLNAITTFSNLLVKGDTVYCAMSENTDWYETAGIGPVYYPEAALVVDNGRISYMKAQISDSSAQNINNILKVFLPWLQWNYPSETAAMMPRGELIHNGRNAAMILGYLREWCEAGKSESSD